ncbi:MAG: SCO family protein [Nitrospiraceae bacterium]|nr:MAG: SCO family protein [Nitrospiraceae bacterium]
MKTVRYVFPVLALLILGIWIGTSLKNNDIPAPIDEYPSATVLNVPVPLPSFSLTDHNGIEFTQWGLSRKWTFMFFGYTFCPDVCPMALVDLNYIYGNLIEKGDLVEEKFGVGTQVVFISVDPGRDTVNNLKEYIAHFNENFIAATGKPDVIDSLTRPIGVAYRLVPGKDPENNYYIDHSASFLLIDPLGRLRAYFSPPHKPAQIAEDFRKLRNKYTEECCRTSIRFNYIKLGDDEEEEEKNNEK